MKRIKYLAAGALSCLLLLSCMGCGTDGLLSGAGSGAKSVAQVRQGPDVTGPEAGKPGDLPGPDNGYLVAEQMGDHVKLDLDGDGQEDELCITVEEMSYQKEKAAWKEPKLTGFVINGLEFADPDGENPLEEYDVNLVTPETDRYFITDLDTSDGVLEIALPDAGPSEDFATWYFHYRDGRLVPIGILPGYPDDEVSRRDGSGNVMAEGRLDLLQTWYATFSFALREEKLEMVPQSWYIPLQDFQNAVTMKQPLTLYAAPDREAETLTVAPSKQVVTFPSTDNDHWVQMRLEDGTEGWLYLTDPITIQSGEESLLAQDVFDNLNLSD